MKKVVLLTGEGFQDAEAYMPLGYLTNRGVEVTVAGVEKTRSIVSLPLPPRKVGGWQPVCCDVLVLCVFQERREKLPEDTNNTHRAACGYKPYTDPERVLYR